VNEQELRQLMAASESESVEFKPGIPSRGDIAEYAVGIGNAGGGWLILGVSDRMPRQVLPLPLLQDEDLARIRESVADAAQIRIEIETVTTTDGAVLAIRIPPRPRGVPFHTQTGKYLIRLGEGLRGMTLSEIDTIRREAGIELTASSIIGNPAGMLSASGMEELRRLMTEAGSAADLIRLSDMDLLRSLGVIAGDGSLLLAGLLLAGKPEAIREHLPHARWQFRRMKSDTDYDQADDGTDCFPVALKRLRELVGANNPIVTIPGMLVHPEFPRYPALALRELIVNALVHRDYEVPGAVTIKLYPDRLELSNPGGFVGGVTAQNILHHPSSPRYPALFQALARMRLANAANLGVPRVFRDLLSEGKEPPSYWNSSQAIRVTIRGQETKREFLELIQHYPGLDVDDLLVIHSLTRHREVTARSVAEICQRSLKGAREILSRLVARWNILEAGGGAGRGRYYRLSRGSYQMLVDVLGYHVDKRLAIENVKARILTALSDRSLTNADVREISQLGRSQVVWILKGLQKEGLIKLQGHGRGSRWKLPGRAR
jgi:ATP-dependent DNA helicase RecG